MYLKKIILNFKGSKLFVASEELELGHLDIKPKQVWCSGCGGGDSLALDKSKKEHKYNSKAGAELILNPISQHIFECLSRLNRCLEVHQNS